MDISINSTCTASAATTASDVASVVLIDFALLPASNATTTTTTTTNTSIIASATPPWQALQHYITSQTQDQYQCAACCETAKAMLCVGEVSFSIYRLVLAGIILLSLIYLAVRVGRSYFALLESGGRSPNAWTLDPTAPVHSVVPLFNSYSLAVCFMLGIQVCLYPTLTLSHSHSENGESG
jgi:hypothetical protein